MVGVGLAWLIGIGFSSVFATAGADVFSFHVDASSILAGWFWGFHLAMVTLFASALWSSKMIIVHALKSVPARVPKHVPWGLYLFVIGALGMSSCNSRNVRTWERSISTQCVDRSRLFNYRVHLPYSVLDCSCPPSKTLSRRLTANLPRSASKNDWFHRCVPSHLDGSAVVIDPIRADLTPNEFSFIVIGLVQVFAGVFVLAALAPLMIRGLLRLASFRSGAVVPVALSYPLHKPLRTAVVMGMFSITVFSVIVLSGYTLQFENYSSSFVEESEGDFELMLSASRSRPFQLDEPIDGWGLENTDIDNIDAVGRVYRAQAFIENEEQDRSPYILRGVDEDFAEHGGLPLHIWDSSLGGSSDEAWCRCKAVAMLSLSMLLSDWNLPSMEQVLASFRSKSERTSPSLMLSNQVIEER